jgi:hypothetical protein
MNFDLATMNVTKHHPAISVKANLRMQVMPEPKLPKDARSNGMNAELNHSSVSVQANLRQQVKSHRDGRSQNRKMMRGQSV